MYQLSEAQRQELNRVLDDILRQVVCDCGNYRHHGVCWMPEGSGEGLSTALDILKKALDAAHADGCRKTVERAAQHKPYLRWDRDGELYDVGCEGCEAKFGAQDWEESWAEHIRALASQVKEAPTFDVRSQTPEEVKDLGNFYKSVYKPIPQPSDAAEREIEKLEGRLAEAKFQFETMDGLPLNRRREWKRNRVTHLEQELALLRSTERKA